MLTIWAIGACIISPTILMTCIFLQCIFTFSQKLRPVYERNFRREDGPPDLFILGMIGAALGTLWPLILLCVIVWTTTYYITKKIATIIDTYSFKIEKTNIGNIEENPNENS